MTINKDNIIESADPERMKNNRITTLEEAENTESVNDNNGTINDWKSGIVEKAIYFFKKKKIVILNS